MSDIPHIEIGTEGESLPVTDVLTGRGFITGKSGSGKSNTASVIVEELLGQGFPALIIDTDGEYWGLKEQYEVLHVGADEECDLQVGPEHAEKLAELSLVQAVPIILDVSGYLEEEKSKALIRETARHLFAREKKEKRPFLMLVEEVHEYLPEGPSLDETGQMLIRVAKRGRKRGLGMVGISQRPADVKKDFITQANWLVWHRLTWDNDTKVVRRVVGSDAAAAASDLDTGEALVQLDWAEEDLQRIRFRQKETFDAGATPGLEDYDRPDLKSVSSDLVGELEEITEKEQRRQDRVAQLEQKLEEERERAEELEEELERARDMSDMAQQFTQALSSAGGGSGEALQEKVDEIREEKNAEIRELRKENETLKKNLQGSRERIESLQEKAARAEDAERLEEHMDDIEEAARRLAEVAGIDLGGDEQLRTRLKKAQKHIRELESQSHTEQPLESLTAFLEHEDVQTAISRAKKQESETQVRRLLTALVEDEGGPVTIEQVCRREGIKATGGNLSRLRGAADALESYAVAEVDGSGKGAKITLTQDLQAVQDCVGRAATREELKDIV